MPEPETQFGRKELLFSPTKLLQHLKCWRREAEAKKDALLRSAPKRLRGDDAMQYAYNIAVQHGKEMAYTQVIETVEAALQMIEEGGS